MRSEAPGFRTTTTSNIQVGVDQIRTLDVTLRVGARTEVVGVQADAALTQTETSSGDSFSNTS